jgi:uncharacterized membrane protein YoaK (UPF0700 family)
MATPPLASAMMASSRTSQETLPVSNQPAKRSWLSTFRDDVHLAHTDLPVLATCIVSGLCDSVAFNAIGVFVSMQTGNTIFLALGAASLPSNQPNLWYRAFVSIAAFWAGCYFFGQSRRFRPQSKLTLSLSFLVQAIFIFIAASLAQSGAVPSFGLSRLPTTLNDQQGALREELENMAVSLVPLAMLAFQFGGQIVTSRVLGVNEVPTNVLTSLYCDLLSDPGLFAPLGKNLKRNRRVASICLLVGGGVAGGWLQRSRAGMSAALWIAGGVKVVISALWLSWRSREADAKGSKA